MQRIDFLNKENEKKDRILSIETEILQKKYEVIQDKSEEKLIKEDQIIESNRLEFFTRFACCQALLFRSWVEASDKLIQKIQMNKVEQKNADIQSLYVDIHEEVFTNLFKSSEYASNLGRMIKASMIMIKNYNILANNFDSDCLQHTNKNHR